MNLPDFLMLRYEELKPAIQKRLEEFALVHEEDYFYELCFCMCTPQSKAKNAVQVIEKLKAKDFFNSPFNASEILRHPSHYIRFHNTKGLRLIEAVQQYPAILGILKSEVPSIVKRNSICRLVNGYGMKESSHFMRNIGYRNLAILDRHILKHLVYCGVLTEVPKSMPYNLYLRIESEFLDFSDKISVPMDELDLLFWSYETGEILK